MAHSVHVLEAGALELYIIKPSCCTISNVHRPCKANMRMLHSLMPPPSYAVLGLTRWQVDTTRLLVYKHNARAYLTRDLHNWYKSPTADSWPQRGPHTVWQKYLMSIFCCPFLSQIYFALWRLPFPSLSEETAHSTVDHHLSQKSSCIVNMVRYRKHPSQLCLLIHTIWS